MNNKIKNFIEEGEKEFEEKFFIDNGKIPVEEYVDIKQFISSRQISLIKIIVEMVESEKEKVPSKDDDSIYPIVVEEINKKLDTISSKLKDLIK